MEHVDIRSVSKSEHYLTGPHQSNFKYSAGGPNLFGWHLHKKYVYKYVNMVQTVAVCGHAIVSIFQE